jgi:acyl-CoA dehydrogenase
MLARRPSPWSDESLELFRSNVKKFLAKEFVPEFDEWERQGFVSKSAWIKAGAAGLLCASIPNEYGGGGGDFRHEMVLLEELDAAGIRGFGNGVHSGIVAHYINAYGSEEQKQRWLPRMARGDLIAAIAMTEPGAGSDLQAMSATAERGQNGYLLNGQKTFISNGQTANLICIAAKIKGASDREAISLLFLETDIPEQSVGFVRGRNLKKIGFKAQDTSELFFDGVQIPSTNLLGISEGLGFKQMMEQLPWERLLIAVSACAGMESVLEMTSEYVKDRKAFGKRILDFQNTQFKLAERYTEAHLARTFLDQCALRLLDGDLDATSACMAKWWMTQKLCEVVDECLQFFGGYGYMVEYPIAKTYADCRILKIWGGSNEIMKSLIARQI